MNPLGKSHGEAFGLEFDALEPANSGALGMPIMRRARNLALVAVAFACLQTAPPHPSAPRPCHPEASCGGHSGFKDGLRTEHSFTMSRKTIVIVEGRKMKHPKMIRAVAILIVAAFTILCSEIALRIANAYFPQPFFYSKHLYRFRAKPFQNLYGFTTNSHGFNDIEHDKEKSPNNYRILSIGDSFAFGVVPYEFNYNTILRRLLKESGYSAEVINMGIPGAAPRNYYAILETEGGALQPDLVIVSFFVGNDFEAVDPGRSWQSYSFVVSLLKYLADVAGKTNFTPWNVGEVYDDSKKSFTDEDYDILEMRRSWVFKKDNPLYQKMYDMTVNDIKLIYELCKKVNSKLVIAIIPDELQINLALRKRALSLAHSSQDEYDFEQPNRMLAGSLKELGITYIDLLPALRRESRSEAVYKPNDSHWNLKGNAVAAHELSAFLRENSVILGR